MGTICSGGHIAVVKSKYGIEVATYRDELEAVLEMIDNGTLGGGNGHGCEEHVVALAAVSNKIEEIRRRLDAEAAEELARQDEA